MFRNRLSLGVLLSCTILASTHADPFFGGASHMLNVTRFFSNQDTSWETKNTANLMTSMGLQTVREGVFAYTATGRAVVVSSAKPTAAQLADIKANRQAIHDRLAVYDAKKFKVVLCAFAVPNTSASTDIINKSFTEFLNEIVAKHPSVQVIELHNEPNLKSFWTATPQEYVDTYRPIATAIKAAHPGVEIIGGSLSATWWNKAFFITALRAGLLDFTDGVAIHPYNVGEIPEIDDIYVPWDAKKDKSHNERSIKAFMASLAPYNKTKKPLSLYFTETGYSSTQKGFTEEMQADYLTRLMMIYMNLRLEGVPLKGVYWYDIKNDGNDPANQQHNYGLVTANLKTMKPAGLAYRRVTASVPAPEKLLIPGLIKVTAEKLNNEGVKTFAWQRNDNKTVLIPFWRFEPVLKADTSANLLITGIPLANVKSVRIINLRANTTPVVIPAVMGTAGLIVPVKLLSAAQMVEIQIK